MEESKSYLQCHLPSTYRYFLSKPLAPPSHTQSKSSSIDHYHHHHYFQTLYTSPSKYYNSQFATNHAPAIRTRNKYLRIPWHIHIHLFDYCIEHDLVLHNNLYASYKFKIEKESEYIPLDVFLALLLRIGYYHDSDKSLVDLEFGVLRGMLVAVPK